MKTPLGKYNMEKNESNCGDYSKVLWAAILDHRYKCEVQRLEPYKGVLIAFDSKENDKVIYELNVPISYDGPFGPDIVDVASWQELIIECVDGNNPPYVKSDV